MTNIKAMDKKIKNETITEMAKRLGVSRNYIYAIKKGTRGKADTAKQRRVKKEIKTILIG